MQEEEKKTKDNVRQAQANKLIGCERLKCDAEI